tara:strand:- start:432 stop:704 length:273 start_codon:yes stop_codon:yes gene_type:complete
MQTRKKIIEDSNAEDSPRLAMVVRKSGMAHLVKSQSSDFLVDEKWGGSKRNFSSGSSVQEAIHVCSKPQYQICLSIDNQKIYRQTIVKFQ